MIIEGLKEYENRVIEPRHKETQGELAAIREPHSAEKANSSRILAGGLFGFGVGNLDCVADSPLLQ